MSQSSLETKCRKIRVRGEEVKMEAGAREKGKINLAAVEMEEGGAVTQRTQAPPGAGTGK